MTHFPASSSILSAANLQDFIIKKYNFSEETTCLLIKTWINDTYLIETASTKYIFRVYHFGWRTRKEIAAEVDLITFFKEKNIAISYPIADAQGNFIQTFSAIEGTRYGVLFSFAAGEKQLNLSPEIHQKIGVMMANIHQNALNLNIKRTTYTPQVLLFDSLKKIEPFLIPESEEAEFMYSTQTILAEALKNINLEKIRRGVVHLDIWADNLNVTTDGEICLFDFDFCGNGWLCMDIAYHLMMLKMMTPDEKIYQEKSASFYKGYEGICGISEEEKRLLPYLATSLFFFYLGVQCERFSTVFVNEIYVAGFIKQRIRRSFELVDRSMESIKLSKQ